jgi:hypothetical protein
VILLALLLPSLAGLDFGGWRATQPWVAHTLVCPAGTEPATTRWFGGERIDSCGRCDARGVCVPHGPAKQWWGDPAVLLWEGVYQEGRKQGLWIYYTYAGNEFLRVDYDDDVPVGAPVPECPVESEVRSTHAWPGGPDLPDPERVDLQLWCEARRESHILYVPRAEWPAKNGPLVEWSPFGFGITHGGYLDGERDGPWRSWYGDGQQESDGFYSAGELDGVWRRWYEDGTAEHSIGYAQGQKHGRWVKWYADGTKSSDVGWQGDKMHGAFHYWYESGALKSTGAYEHGEKVGVWRRFRDDGSLKERTAHVGGEVGTEIASFHENGGLATLTREPPGGGRLRLLSATEDGRLIPRDRQSCARHGGKWLPGPHDDWPDCKLPSPERQARCAAAGTCAVPCLVGSVLPPGAEYACAYRLEDRNDGSN